MLAHAIDLYNKGDYERSIAILQARLVIAEKEKDKKTMAVIYNNFGNNYNYLGKQAEALRCYQTSITLAEQINDKRSIARTTKNIGSMYADTKDFSKAIVKYNEAEKLATAINDTPTLADIANNKGVMYEQQQKDYPHALEQYSKALQLYLAMGQEDRIAILYNNLGIVYKFLKDHDRSIDCYRRSLAISEKLGDKFMIAANLVNMGNVYEMKGETDKAIPLIEKAIGIAKEIGSPELEMEAIESLASNYARKGDHKKGYELYKVYTSMHDSLASIERSGQLAEIQTKYETEKKEKQIAQLERTRYKMLAVIGIMVLLIIVAYLLYNRQQIRQAQLKEQAVRNAEFNERMRIAKDMHDDLGSGLSKISLTAGLAARKVGDTTVLHDVRQISAISKDLVDNMHDLIWVLNPENTTLDNLVSRMREYCADYLDGMGLEPVLIFPSVCPPTRISHEAQRNLFFTVKEAINNVVKHAGATSIHITVVIDEQALHITIADNGKGIDLGRTKNSGAGLRNMKQRIESIGGTYVLDTQASKGTTISVSVSLDKLHAARRGL
ncbi:hypothetical protein GCM10023093_15880 [Nemorincola caseinilytica]|uniref:Histidine kinase domain-containing protein n=1 Tax=Nemorincola caseinilytica TaxID=2054315 RepID=A0ABP8NF10_9BACT